MSGQGPDPDRSPLEEAARGLREAVEIACVPLNRIADVTSQLRLTPIPPEHSCNHLCPIYTPHLCDGWRGKDTVVEVPGEPTPWNKTPPARRVPVCGSCAAAPLREC